MSNILRTACLTVAAVCSVYSSLENKKIKVVDNGYTGVTIAISREIKENGSQLLIQRLKDLFTEASAQLYVSTRHHLYFRDITIVVPQTWSKKPQYENVSGSQFDMAHVVLGPKNDQVGSKPYVFGMTDCGAEAHHIHLDSFYVKRRLSTKGKTMVHQWGHFRWGLFDEYPGSEYPSLSKEKPYYHSQGTLKPNVCTNQISGDFLMTDNCYGQNAKICTVVNGQLSPGCKFCPNRNSPSQASIMTDYFSDIDTISQFCDNSTVGGLRHNKMADTKQNRFCDRRSAWEVMLSHPDFQGLKAGPPSQNTVPSFKIVQQDVRKVVLILDISGSMRNDQKLERLVQATSNFLLNIIDDETKVGLVVFSNTANILRPLTVLSSESIRKQFVDSLPQTAQGGTSIGAGLRKGIECLRNSGESTDGSILFLVSDGKEENQPYIKDVAEDVDKAGVVVMSLAFTNRSDIKMVELASKTSGRSFFYSGEPNSTVLVDAFFQTVGRSADTPNALVLIKSMPITVSKTEPYSADFYIDSSVGKDTAVTLSGTSLGGVSISATASSGTVYKSATCGSSVCKLSIPGLSEIGQYKLSVTSTSGTTSTLICNVQSYQRTPNAEIISVKAWISGDNLNLGSNTQIKLFASVMKGFKPIIKADVTGVIGSGIPPIVLKDNGIGADTQEDDGIYSAFILPKHLTGNGRMNAKILVSDGNKTSVIVAAKRRRRDTVPTEDIHVSLTTSSAEKFERTTQAGEFRVTNYGSSMKDVLPPSKITTLKVMSAKHSSRKFFLQFKAVGDDFDVGEAALYDVRIAEDFDLLTESPETAPRVDEGVPLPGESGSVQTLNITLPEVGPTYYVGIRAVDANNNTGELSNIVSLSVLTDKKFLTPRNTASPTVLHQVSKIWIAFVFVVIDITIITSHI